MSTWPPFRTWIEVSLSRLRDNYRSIASTLPQDTQMMPVVKANAYGHGALPVARLLVEQGCRWLAVSSASEGDALRQGGIERHVRILVMAGLCEFDWPLVLQAQLTPVLHNLTDLSTYDKLVGLHLTKTGATQPLPFHFKLDTGLTRLGSCEELPAIISAFHAARHCKLEGLMTHFASAASLKSPLTGEQVSTFQQSTETIRESGLAPFLIHMDATNSLHLRRHATPVHLVRPGHAIYGYVTQPAGRAVGRLSVEPALSWKARILLLKSVPEGTPVGYGSLFRTSRPSTLAVLAVGYSDGYPHQLSNKGSVLVNGHSAPIAGAISMDVCTIDVTGIPDVKVGQEVTLLGKEGPHEITAIHLGRLARTISYSILCNISDVLPRVYIDEESKPITTEE